MAIGIAALFLVLGFSVSTVISEYPLKNNPTTSDFEEVFIRPEDVILSGKGWAWKSFWLKNSHFPYIMFGHYDYLDYGFIITQDGKRIDLEHSLNVLVFGLSYGSDHKGYGFWFGFLEPSSFGHLDIDCQHPLYARIF